MRVSLLLLARVLSSLPSNADAVDAVDAAARRRSGSASAILEIKSKQEYIAGPLATVARLRLGRLARYIRCGLAGIFVAMSMFTSAPFLLQTIPARGYSGFQEYQKHQRILHCGGCDEQLVQRIANTKTVNAAAASDPALRKCTKVLLQRVFSELSGQENDVCCRGGIASCLFGTRTVGSVARRSCCHHVHVAGGGFFILDECQSTTLRTLCLFGWK